LRRDINVRRLPVQSNRSIEIFFSIDDLLDRIADENFVPNKRYAELILAEVPKNKRLDSLIRAFESRDLANSQKHKEFFQAGIADLESDEIEKLFDVISAHLRKSNSDEELRSVFQLLTPDQWMLVAEAERLRSENRVIRSVASGKYSTTREKCLSGAMSTWATSFLGKFTLKTELLREVYAALISNSRERQDFILKYFFVHLDDLSTNPPPHIKHHIIEKLELGDARYKDALEDLTIFGAEEWLKPFASALENFVENQEAAPFDDDELPF
jgi:hypothetical protein